VTPSTSSTAPRPDPTTCDPAVRGHLATPGTTDAGVDEE
jgi:hypothetical protein